MDNKPTLLHVETHVSNICNLNCQACGHFSNIYEGEPFVDIENFKQHVTYLSTKVNVKKFILYGGEPLLNPNVKDFILLARDIFPHSKVVLGTNGVLLDKMDNEFWKLIKENDIQMLVSLYRPFLDKKDCMISLFDKYDIPYWLATDKKNGYMKMFHKDLNINADSDMYKAHNNCHATYYDLGAKHYCFCLRDNYLYKCGLMAYLDMFIKRYDVDSWLKIKRGIDIYKVKNWDFAHLQLQCAEECCKCCKENDTDFEWGNDAPQKEDWCGC